jgi:hypothetical protein
MIPEIDIWRVANLMLRRYGDEAVLYGPKSFSRRAITTVWRRVIDAIVQLLNTTPPGPVH